ncbi:MAG: hypothetical protein IT436_13985 [Phycisphaerales bacterium]|nr:hypothetical protein [Phycisphaerales bacterium]
MNPRRIATQAGVALTLLAVGWWALRPLERPDLSLPSSPPPSPRPSESPGQPDGPSTLVALDDAAFRIPLWFTPPPVPPSDPIADTKPAPLPPFKLQLLAILRQGDPSGAGPAGQQFKALLYDPDTDKIVEAAAGQSIGERTVVGITEREMTLKERAGIRTLSLRPAESPGGGL